MLGLWSKNYESPNMAAYGDELTYRIAEEHLKGLDVEDWGCGHGRFKDFHEGTYIGIDGSKSERCLVVRDLREPADYIPGILLRHVLEHNTGWKIILNNALKSVTDTLVVVLFTPFQEETKQIGWSDDIGVPDIGFSLTDLRKELPDDVQMMLDIPSPSTQYGIEHVIVVKKKKRSDKNAATKG